MITGRNVSMVVGFLAIVASVFMLVENLKSEAEYSYVSIAMGLFGGLALVLFNKVVFKK